MIECAALLRLALRHKPRLHCLLHQQQFMLVEHWYLAKHPL
jgi:hypothetical protein